MKDLLELKEQLSGLSTNNFFKAESVITQLFKVQELLVAAGCKKGTARRRQILRSVEDQLATTVQTLNKKLNSAVL